MFNYSFQTKKTSQELTKRKQTKTIRDRFTTFSADAEHYSQGNQILINFGKHLHKKEKKSFLIRKFSFN